MCMCIYDSKEAAKLILINLCGAVNIRPLLKGKSAWVAVAVSVVSALAYIWSNPLSHLSSSSSSSSSSTGNAADTIGEEELEFLTAQEIDALVLENGMLECNCGGLLSRIQMHSRTRVPSAGPLEDEEEELHQLQEEHKEESKRSTRR